MSQRVKSAGLQQAATVKSQWHCATEILTHYDADGEYIEPEQRKPVRKIIGKANPHRHDISVYQYDKRYEYSAPQFIDLTQYDDVISDDTFFHVTHKEHEPLTAPPPAVPLYNEQSNTKPSLSPKRLLRHTPGKAQRVTNVTNDDSDTENTEPKRNKSKLAAAKHITVKSKVNSNHKTNNHVTTRRSVKQNEVDAFTMDDIFDDDIAKLLEQHNNAIGATDTSIVTTHSAQQHVKSPTTIQSNTTVITPVITADATQTTAPTQRIKANIAFTAATSKPTKSTTSKSVANDNNNNTKKAKNAYNNHPAVKVSRHLVGTAGFDAFADSDIAALLIAHNQAVRAVK